MDKNMFCNPIIKGGYPDPSVCRVGDDVLHGNLLLLLLSGTAGISKPGPGSLGTDWERDFAAGPVRFQKLRQLGRVVGSYHPVS